MADIQPLRALHYDLNVTGSLQDVVAPPYDVIDEAQRAQLIARSPYNVVSIDLPEGDDPYAAADEMLEHWRMQGAVVRDSEPALWALQQDYTAPDGRRLSRRGFFARVRVQEYGPGRIRPHERTHPGPKEDRLRLTRATRANLSPIFSLYSDPTGAAQAALEPSVAEQAWGEATDEDGTVNRLWRIGDGEAISAVQGALASAELLIADGHHRYETARVYADEIGGEGEHRYVLMCLVALEDPGLTVFPTHRLVRGLDSDRRQALREAITRDFEVQEVPRDEIAPPEGTGPLELGYIDSHHRKPYRLRLKDQATADSALADHAEAYRRLDTGILEALLLKGALGMTDEDISHLNGFGYARDGEQALGLIDSGTFDAAFIMRPTPVAQVREVAAAGENMPPKSTYFFPKILTGMLFNPLE
jgi:uncharacterized protein (DUF1015 family)